MNSDQNQTTGLITKIFEDEARDAIVQIAAILGVTENEAIQRALGTELFLLDQVRNERAKVFVESARGRVEIDLFLNEPCQG